MRNGAGYAMTGLPAQDTAPMIVQRSILMGDGEDYGRDPEGFRKMTHYFLW